MIYRAPAFNANIKMYFRQNIGETAVLYKRSIWPKYSIFKKYRYIQDLSNFAYILWENVLLSKHILNNPSQYWIWIDMICVVSTALSHDKKIALDSKYSQDCKEFEYRLKYFRRDHNFLVAFLGASSILISKRKFF